MILLDGHSCGPGLYFVMESSLHFKGYENAQSIPIAVLGVEGAVGDFGSRQSDGQQAARPLSGNLAGPRVRARRRRRRSVEVAIMMMRAFAK